MNLLLGYPFNSRWFMDPLLARKDPVAGGCKYHHQVFIAELFPKLQTVYESPASQKGSWLGAASITTRYLLLSYPFNSRWFMDPLLARKDPVSGGCKYHHQVVIAELSL
jgi:hypothetical protein